MADKLIVEADGGSRGNPGVAGYGALVRDAQTRDVLAERAAPLGKQSNNVAEYTGLIEGLRAVVEHAPESLVTVRMDSKLVIEQMSGRWKIKHEDMKRLAAQAQEIVRDINAAGGDVTFEWIPREKNKDADKLSNDGMDGLTVVVDRWPDEPAENAEPAAESATGESTPAEAAPSALGGSSDDEGTPDEEEQSSGADDAPLKAQQQVPSLQAPTRIILVRHGVTEATERGLLDGRGGDDPELSPTGFAQADAAAHAITSLVGPDVAVISSTLRRARQTAQQIAGRLGATADSDADWDEQSFGAWNGMSFRELHEQDAPGLVALRNDPTYQPPQGESRQEVDVRVGRALDRVCQHGGTVVVVTHRVVIMSVLARLLGLDMAGAWRLAAAPASFTGLEVWPDGNGQVAFLNDTHHLR